MKGFVSKFATLDDLTFVYDGVFAIYNIEGHDLTKIDTVLEKELCIQSILNKNVILLFTEEAQRGKCS